MNHRSASGIGLTRLLSQALIALLVGIVVSICALIVQAFLVLSGRRASTSGEQAENAADLHIGCSLCLRRNRLNTDSQSPYLGYEYKPDREFISSGCLAILVIY